MALEIFKLVGSIFVDNEKANKSIAKTDKKAEGLGKKMLEGVGTAAKWGAGIVTATAGAVTAVSGLAMSVADTAGDIDDAAKKVGTTAEEYQKWAYAANLGGMEASKLEALMVKQQKAFSDAKEGSKAMSEAYQRLGIDIENISNSGDAFNEVIAALADMEDVTTRNALANDIFGKSYADLAPLLAEGSAGIEKMKQEAADLGGVMSNEAVEAGAQFGDSIDRLKTSAKGILYLLSASAIPLLTSFIDLIVANMPMIQEMFERFTPVTMQLMEGMLPLIAELTGQFVPILLDLIIQLMPLLTEIASTVLPVFTELVKMILPPIIQIVETLLPPLLKLLEPILRLLEPVIKLLQPILDVLVAVLEPIGYLVDALLVPLVDIIVKLIEVALEPLQSKFEVISLVISTVFLAAFEHIKSYIETIKGVFSGFITFISGVFTGDWKKAWDGITKIFTSIWEGIENAFKMPFNVIIDGINKFIKGVNEIKIPEWVPAVGGSSFNIKELPKLEDGALLEKGQVGILEGNGAEAVVPLENNKKWIASIAREMQSQGIGGAYGKEILDMLRKIYDRLDEMSITEIIRLVPDSRRLFEIIREESEVNAARGGEPITV